MIRLSDLIKAFRESKRLSRCAFTSELNGWLKSQSGQAADAPESIEETKLFRLENGQLTRNDRWIPQAVGDLFGTSDELERLALAAYESERIAPTTVTMCEEEYSSRLDELLRKPGREQMEVWLPMSSRPPILDSEVVQRTWLRNIDQGLIYNLCWIPDVSMPSVVNRLGRFIASHFMDAGDVNGVRIRHFLLPPSSANIASHEKLLKELTRHVEAVNRVAPSANGTKAVEVHSIVDDSTDLDQLEIRVRMLLHATPLGQIALFREESVYRSFASFAATAAVAEPGDEERRLSFQWLHPETVDELHDLTGKIRGLSENTAGKSHHSGESTESELDPVTENTK